MCFRCEFDIRWILGVLIVQALPLLIYFRHCVYLFPTRCVSYMIIIKLISSNNALVVILFLAHPFMLMRLLNDYLFEWIHLIVSYNDK